MKRYLVPVASCGCSSPPPCGIGSRGGHCSLLRCSMFLPSPCCSGFCGCALRILAVTDGRTACWSLSVFSKIPQPENLMKHRFFNLNFGRKDFYIFCMALEIYVVEGKCYGISSLILVINSWKSAIFFVLSFALLPSHLLVLPVFFLR